MIGLMCLAQGRNAVTLVRLEPASLQSQVKHSTTEPLRSQRFISSSIPLLCRSQCLLLIFFLTLCMLGSFSCFNCRLLTFFFSKLTFSKISFRNTVSLSNSLDPDQDPILGPNCLQSNISRRLWQAVISLSCHDMDTDPSFCYSFVLIHIFLSNGSYFFLFSPKIYIKFIISHCQNDTFRGQLCNVSTI